jgi:hypothetical protein
MVSISFSEKQAQEKQRLQSPDGEFEIPYDRLSIDISFTTLGTTAN